MRAVFRLVQRPHAQAADVAGCVVAGRNRVVRDGVGADEADLGVVVVVVFRLGRRLVGRRHGAGLFLGRAGGGGEILRSRLRGTVLTATVASAAASASTASSTTSAAAAAAAAAVVIVAVLAAAVTSSSVSVASSSARGLSTVGRRGSALFRHRASFSGSRFGGVL